jgi:putative flippase GtrA
VPDQQREDVPLNALDVGPGHPPLKQQLFRFVVTGGLSAVVDFGLLVLLMTVGVPHIVAKAISFICGTTTAYVINRRWTFKAVHTAARFLGVMSLYGFTFVVQVGLFSLLFPLLRSWDWRILYVQVVSFVIAQGVATTVNFVVQRTVIFRRAAHVHHEGPASRVEGRGGSVTG